MFIGIMHFHWLAAGVACLLFLFRFTLQAVIVNKMPATWKNNVDITSHYRLSTYCSRYSLYVGNGTVCSARKAIF